MIPNKPTMNIEIAGFRQESTSDGPGVRGVLFLQGCSRKCAGCHNISTHKKGLGKTMTIDELIMMLEERFMFRRKKITISGGEPLDQPEALEELVNRLYALDYDICLYTSYQLEDVSLTIREKLSSIKTGPFLLSKKNPDATYYGSSNQQFFRNTNFGYFEKVA